MPTVRKTRPYIQKPASGNPRIAPYWAQNLAGCWAMTDGSGTTVPNCAMPGTNDGTFTSGPTWAAGLNGWGVSTVIASSNYIDCGSLPAMSGVTQFSLFALGNKATGLKWAIGQNVSSGGAWGIESWSDNNIYVQQSAVSNTPFGQITSANFFGDFSLTFAFDGTSLGSGFTSSCNIYWNGIKQTVGSGSGVPTATTNAGCTNFYIGRNVNQPTFSTGRYDLVLLWPNRLLSAADAVSLHANPWQVFQPGRGMILKPATAGGASVIVPYYHLFRGANAGLDL